MADREAWERVGAAVLRRRVQLGMRTREAFATRVGLSTKTLGEIERGARTSYDAGTLAAVEQALDWPEGHIDQILRPPSGAAEEPSDRCPPELRWRLGLEPEPEPELGRWSLTEILRTIRRDDFVLGVLVFRAGLGDADMLRLVVRVRQLREQQNMMLLGEVAEYIRELGGTAPEPVWPPAWLGEDSTAGG